NVNYIVAVKVPLRKLSTVEDLLSTPITPTNGALNQSANIRDPLSIPGSAAQRLGNLITYSTSSSLDEINHSNVQRVLNIDASVDGRDLGGVIAEINKAVASLGGLPAGTAI